MDAPYRRRLPIPGLTEGEDRLMGMIVALTAQVASMRERIDTLETLLEAGGSLKPGAIEGFAPDAEATARRDGLRAALVAKVLQPLRDALARNAGQGSSPGEEADV